MKVPGKQSCYSQETTTARPWGHPQPPPTPLRTDLATKPPPTDSPGSLPTLSQR